LILVGTSGFSYPDWRGPFYPAGLPRTGELDYYRRRFRALELNFTYYRIPTVGQAAALASRGRGLVMTAKTHRDMTHTGKATDSDYSAFRRALEPLLQEGSLTCLLAQFPWSFKPSAENRRVIGRLRQRLEPFPVVVEFRCSGWEARETIDFLAGQGIGLCAVDEPRLKGLFPPLAVVTSDIAYLRFHGRNGRAWWSHENPHERYDYLYGRSQLEEWIPRIRAMDAEAGKTFVFTNNHYEAKAVKNARMLIELLAEDPGPQASG